MSVRTGLPVHVKLIVAINFRIKVYIIGKNFISEVYKPNKKSLFIVVYKLWPRLKQAIKDLGHINTGLYKKLREKCRLIVVCTNKHSV